MAGLRSFGEDLQDTRCDRTNQPEQSFRDQHGRRAVVACGHFLSSSRGSWSPSIWPVSRPSSALKNRMDFEVITMTCPVPSSALALTTLPGLIS